MSGPDREWTSAWLDDAQTAAERQRGARVLSRDAAARRRLGRYQLIGDALRGDLPESWDPHFARRVHGRVVAAACAPAPAHGLQGLWRWLRQPVPLAAGAVVAVLAAGGLWWLASVHRTAPQAEVPLAAVLPATPTEDEMNAQLQQQILSYLAAHAEVEPQALMPYTHLVDYDE